MVWIIEWRATDSLHKTCGNDTSLPSKQKKISQRSNVQAKIRPSNMFDQSVIPEHHKHKTHDGETGENRSLPRQLLKGVELTLLWCKTSNAEQQTVHTRLAAMTKVFHSGRKNISQGSIGPYNTPNSCKPGTRSKQKFAFQICSTNLLFPSITSIKRRMERQQRTGHFHVNSQRGVKHVLRWCEKKSAEQPTIYTRYTAMTQVFHRSRKKISQGSTGPYNTPNNCKPETDSQQKNTFHKCSIHVLISNITSLKRQMQRQERTGHFHVNSQRGVEHVLRWCE